MAYKITIKIVIYVPQFRNKQICHVGNEFTANGKIGPRCIHNRTEIPKILFYEMLIMEEIYFYTNTHIPESTRIIIAERGDQSLLHM